MNLFDRFLPGLTKTSRDRVVDTAAADFVPLAVDWASMPGISTSTRERDLRLAKERYGRDHNH